MKAEAQNLLAISFQLSALSRSVWAFRFRLMAES
jgi:hypothetical protein